MKIIERSHNFENTLNHVEKKNKYFYLRHEKDTYPIRVKITPELNVAFLKEDWSKFEAVEMIYYADYDPIERHLRKPIQIS